MYFSLKWNTFRTPMSNWVSRGVSRDPGAMSWIVSEPCAKPGSTRPPGFGQLQSSGYLVVGEMVQFTVLYPCCAPLNTESGNGGPVVLETPAGRANELKTGSE